MSVVHATRSATVRNEQSAPPTTAVPGTAGCEPAPAGTTTPVTDGVDVAPAGRRRLRRLIDVLTAPDVITAELDRSPTYRRAKADAEIGAMRRNITI